MRISFGPFAFDPQSRLLWRDGAEVALPPRVLGVLEVLIERAGDVVPRQALLDRVWKDAFVTDTSLAEAVSFLRQALGDDPQAPRYIQTLHRRGYRFLAPVGSDPAPGAAVGVRGLTPYSHSAAASGDRVETATGDAAKVDRAFEVLPWMVALFCLAFGAAALWRNAKQPLPDAPPVARFDVRTAEGMTFDTRGEPIAISPDGRLLAWSACDATDGCALYLRPLDRVEAVKIAGTEDASGPAFSPDARWIAFFADGKLKKIATSGGAASTLADAPSPAGVAWGSDGRIVFAGSAAGGLSLVDEEGGGVRAVTTPRLERGELRHRSPAWLPGGDILFTIASSPLADAPGELAVAVPPHNTIAILRSGVTRAVPAGYSHLVLSTGSDLQAATFDAGTLALTGRADSVLTEAGANGVAHFTVGANGTLALIRASPAGPLTWNDPSDLSITGLSRVDDLVVSPDSRHAAAVVRDGNGVDIWTLDLASGAIARITFGGTNLSPAWSPDGQRIVYATRGAGKRFQLASKRLDERAATSLPTATAVLPTSVATAGRIAVTIVKDGRTAIGTVAGTGGMPRLLTDGPFDESAAVFSPDARWLALESTESGRPEIVARETQSGRRIAVSTHGGTRPRWSEDGRWIYYDHGRRLMRAPFRPDGNPQAAPAETVFDRGGVRAVAVTPSGRVLAQRHAAATEALVVLQWLRELRDRLPPPIVLPR